MAAQAYGYPPVYPEGLGYNGAIPVIAPAHYFDSPVNGRNVMSHFAMEAMNNHDQSQKLLRPSRLDAVCKREFNGLQSKHPLLANQISSGK